MAAAQKIAERRWAKEAKSRRRVNEDWQRIESTGEYRKTTPKAVNLLLKRIKASEFDDHSRVYNSL